MTNYGNPSFFSKVKSFFFKVIFLTISLFGLSIYFLTSDFGNSYSLISDFKAKSNSYFSNIYNEKIDFFESKIRNILGLKNNSESQLKTTENSNTLGVTKESTQSFTNYKIPFYYDHSNAPNGVTKEMALMTIQKSSKLWSDACGVEFEYKGEKLADYVNDKSTLKNKIGIIKWNTQMDKEDVIGQAHLGNTHGPAKGFVLSLYTDFFGKNNNQDLINTITHEMGHVIGLPHSDNAHSIMYASEDSYSSLQKSDVAMCKYFRYRWNGMNATEAEAKSGVLFNGGFE